MIGKALLALAVLMALMAGVGYTLYVRNPPPSVPTLSADETARSGKPVVVKLHAQWCAVCMLTKDVWADIEKTYADRVHLVVLDFTNAANTAASRTEAERLGLQTFYEEFSGATGTIVVLDGRTRNVTASINGSRDFEEYRTAIDAALAGPPGPARAE